MVRTRRSRARTCSEFEDETSVDKRKRSSTRSLLNHKATRFDFNEQGFTVVAVFLNASLNAMFPLKKDHAASPGTPPPMQGSKLEKTPFSSCKRARSLLNEPQSVSRAAIRKLARRAGVKRIGTDFYPDAQTCLRRFLGGIVKDIGAVTEHARRRTVTVGDVLLVLKRHGRCVLAKCLANKSFPPALPWGSQTRLSRTVGGPILK